MIFLLPSDLYNVRYGIHSNGFCPHKMKIWVRDVSLIVKKMYIIDNGRINDKHLPFPLLYLF